MVRIIDGEVFMQLRDLVVAKRKTPNPLSGESFYNIDDEEVIQRGEEFVKVEHKESIDWLKTQSSWLLIEGSVPLKPEEIERDIGIYKNKLLVVYGKVPKEIRKDIADYFDTSYKLVTLQTLLTERTKKS